MMINIDEIYEAQSNYLRVADLQGKRAIVTIKNAELKKFGDSSKIVLSFEDTLKQFALNKTNSRILRDLINSPDAEDSIGYTISLRPDKTLFQDKTVDCIRVDFELPEQKHKKGEEKIPF